MTVGGRSLPLSRALVRRIVQTVLQRERRVAVISVTFLGPRAMRRLNRAHKGLDQATDVLSFALAGPNGTGVGDVYVCASVARQEAKTRRIPVREELVRLVVHGTLHVLGYDHPEGDSRIESPMWRRQERYVKALT